MHDSLLDSTIEGFWAMNRFPLIEKRTFYLADLDARLMSPATSPTNTSPPAIASNNNRPSDLPSAVAFGSGESPVAECAVDES
jgi:hypothetical protein